MTETSRQPAPSWFKQRARGYAREAYFRLRHRLALRGVEARNPILIYQMGKVGSSTLVNTLHRVLPTEPVLHVHTLSPEHLRHATARQRASLAPYLPEHLIVSSLLVKKLSRGRFPCRIITLTREPVARAISFVFEDLKKQAPEALQADGSLDTGAVIACVNRLLATDNGIADPTRWFDDELRACWGVDVFAEPYDAERGYAMMRQGGVSVLVLRMEDMNRSLPAALGAFLEIDPSQITVERANIGSEKWYADALDHVKKTFHLSPENAAAVLGTRYFSHFYTGETERVSARWAPDVSTCNPSLS